MFLDKPMLVGETEHRSKCLLRVTTLKPLQLSFLHIHANQRHRICTCTRSHRHSFSPEIRLISSRQCLYRTTCHSLPKPGLLSEAFIRRLQRARRIDWKLSKPLALEGNKYLLFKVCPGYLALHFECAALQLEDTSMYLVIYTWR